MNNSIKVVGAILYQNDGIIFGRRSSSSKSFPGLLEFPGGKIENNESSKEALIRELKEELDIDVKEQDIFEFEGNESIHSLDNNGKDIHLFLYIVNKWTNTPIIKEGIHDELKHIYLDDLDTIKDMIPGDQIFIPKIKNFVNKKLK